jgi:C_GCAxxG_C_C family probable redox protein
MKFKEKTINSELPDTKIMTKQETINKAVALFDEGYACSQAILLSFAERYNLDENTAKLISSTFGGGMGRLRQKCGAVTSGFMVLGLAYGNKVPKDMETKLAAYKKVRELNGLVEEIHGTSNCSELLIKHVTEAEVADRKHHKIICKKIVGDVAGLLYDMLEK